MEAVFKRMDTAELETVFKMKSVASGMRFICCVIASTTCVLVFQLVVYIYIYRQGGPLLLA